MRLQPSYWEKAFLFAELPSSPNGDDPGNNVDIEMFVNHLASLTGEDGSQKYPILTSFYFCILAISHGNSAPENGFSINKNMLEVHGNSIEPETIEALRLVKDTILTFDSIVDIPITRDFIGSVKSARQRYFADLEIKKKPKDQETDCVQTKENTNNEFAQEKESVSNSTGSNKVVCS